MIETVCCWNKNKNKVIWSNMNRIWIANNCSHYTSLKVLMNLKAIKTICREMWNAIYKQHQHHFLQCPLPVLLYKTNFIWILILAQLLFFNQKKTDFYWILNFHRHSEMMHYFAKRNNHYKSIDHNNKFFSNQISNMTQPS